MKVIKLIILIVFISYVKTLAQQSVSNNFGKARILNQYPLYEEENIFNPHDAFMNSDLKDIFPDMVLEVINLRRTPELVKITNKLNSGLGGYEVKFDLSPDLEIKNVEYNKWDDHDNGSSIEYSVEKVILALSGNPFKDSLFYGHYTLQILNNFQAGEILKEQGQSDTSYYSVFYGKFKFYSHDELKEGKERITDKVERKYAIKDEDGIYWSVDLDADFKQGESKLDQILNRWYLENNSIIKNSDLVPPVSFIVDEFGLVDLASLEVSANKNSRKIIESLKLEKELWNNWSPAIRKGKRVKSKKYIYLPVKESKNP